MIRAVLLVALGVIWLAPGLDAEAVKCLSTEPCKRPPCQFMRELKIAKAIVRAYSIPITGDGDATNYEAFQSDRKQTKAEINKAYAKYAKCPSTIFYRPPPSLFVSSMNGQTCQIERLGQAVTLEQVLAISNSCSESVEAEFASAKQFQLNCWAFQKETEPVTVAEHRSQWRRQEEARVKSLEKSLLRHLSSCAPNDATSKQLSDLGLKSLMKKGAKARREWKKAKRAAARRK